MKEKGLPTEFWGEAMAIVVYLINMCPTKVVRDRIPIEAWSRGRWTVEHLRVFGCVAYAHVPKEKSLPTEFWGEAVATVVYLINRCPTKAVRDRIPMEAW